MVLYDDYEFLKNKVMKKMVHGQLFSLFEKKKKKKKKKLIVVVVVDEKVVLDKVDYEIFHKNFALLELK
eukprot:CAMPEP_0201560606 /NCGR_PEP_ID=MMETSP0173_2-20130828/78359_1 /ASSEMBLY_ACC=CAM_ASM_000268 /TAXON_ID=218659 /ORGANISM="Vexillifera sp., Strain DIVA3 564/2" /LENGTH=68 /DNA_ID=CAMNT_0047975063 /DNA_START=664 /DNA_END=870 /DNA_ORIENTATION=+